jgi:hypothetical protein
MFDELNLILVLFQENKSYGVNVPDKRSWILEVVVVRRILAGYWEFGVGREWGRVEKGRSVYKQPGTGVDKILSQQGGFQVSKGAKKGEQKGN